jgi:hypothetical protein
MYHYYFPGQIAPYSGQYVLVDPFGQFRAERTIVRGEPFPPTPSFGWRYVLRDPTANRSGGLGGLLGLGGLGGLGGI